MKMKLRIIWISINLTLDNKKLFNTHKESQNNDEEEDAIISSSVPSPDLIMDSRGDATNEARRDEISH
jgi:hypothetical protein